MTSIILSEKQLPHILKTMIANPEARSHMLFLGPPGSGKTTAAQSFSVALHGKNLNKFASLLFLNSSDERSLEIIRQKIYPFVESRMQSLFFTGKAPPKLIIFDEAETLTDQAGEPADGAQPDKALAASEPAPLPETAAAEKVAPESIVAEVAARDGEPAIAIGDASPQADEGTGCVAIPEAAAVHSQSDQPPSSEPVTPAVAESATSAAPLMLMTLNPTFAMSSCEGFG
jgi:hypothetical protein